MGSDFVTWNIKGLQEIEFRLNALPEKVKRKHLRSAMTDAAEIIRAQAQRNVSRIRRKTIKDDFLFFLRGPDLSPRLRNHVEKKVTIGKLGARARVGLDYKEVHHGHLVEFGTGPHEIFIKMKSGHYFKIHHPGSKKQPFMRPAYDAKAGEATELLIARLMAAVEMEA
jgi:HK97 gp10 family phage protein